MSSGQLRLNCGLVAVSRAAQLRPSCGLVAGAVAPNPTCTRAYNALSTSARARAHPLTGVGVCYRNWRRLRASSGVRRACARRNRYHAAAQLRRGGDRR